MKKKNLKLRSSEPYPTLVAGGPPYPSYSTDTMKYGLSILDWFAGHVAAGLAANTLVVKGSDPTNEEAEIIAETAYTIAAYLVDVRANVPIEPTPVPPGEVPPSGVFIPPVVPNQAAPQTSVRLGPPGPPVTATNPVADLRPPTSVTSA